MKLACLAVLLVVACGGTVTNDGDAGSNGDASSKDATPTDVVAAADVTTTFDAGAFCSGSSPKLQVNGADATIVKASGKAIILNCCDSAELTIASAQFQGLMFFMWRAAPLSSGSIDLANPPQGFSIEMDLGCDPSTSSCASASPEERYTDGFTGTLDYTAGSGGLSVSYCLHIDESPSQPHAVIHSLALYAPNITSP